MIGCCKAINTLSYLPIIRVSNRNRSGQAHIALVLVPEDNTVHLAAWVIPGAAIQHMGRDGAVHEVQPVLRLDRFGDVRLHEIDRPVE